MRYILIILLFTSMVCQAVTSPPLVLRACLNYDTDIVTLSWRQPSDLCGSFTKYSIYGSEDNGLFIKLDDITNIAIEEYPHQLAVANTNWRYYITILTLCDGLDSATSNEVLVDNIYPTIIEIDSLSYDLNTQNIIAGWTQNPSPDNKGYELYEFNPGSNSADSIGTTIDNNINITNLRKGNYPVVLSSYDSCNLTSIFSTPHKAVLLRGNLDTCARAISLNWNIYQGWSLIDSQVLFVSISGGPFIRDTTLNKNINSFVYRNLTLGDTLIFYLRTHKGGTSITSSSSKITFETRELATPSHLYLNWVTVNDNPGGNSSISLSWDSDKLQDIRTFQLERRVPSQNYIIIKSLASMTGETEYSYNDLGVNADLNIYTYRVLGMNKCGDTVLISNESSNILLNITPSQTHNPYLGWENGVSTYELEHSQDRSTWNTLYTNSETILGENTDSTGCYRIVAREVLNSLNSVSLSYSNVKCRYDSLKFFVTTAVAPNGTNNKFIIEGRGIDLTRSTYEIYNRWGQLITQSNVTQPWYADYQNSPVQSGIYLYIVKMYGVLGEYKTESGTVNVIR